MIPVGISSSTNYFTGFYIGKNRVDLAEKIANLCVLFSFFWVLTEVTLLKIFENYIISFYTKNIGSTLWFEGTTVHISAGRKISSFIFEL